MGTIGVTAKLHAVKLLAHAKKLKDKVFSKRIKQLSPELDQWHAGHVAAWLHANINAPLCATSILKCKADGNTLLDLYIDEDDKPLRDLLDKTSVDEKEIVLAIDAIKEKFHPHLLKGAAAVMPSSAMEGSDSFGGVGKKETAMAKKRRLITEAKAKAKEDAKLQSEVALNEKSVSVNDKKFEGGGEDDNMVENEQESVDDAPAVIEAHGKDEDEDEERAGNEDTGEGEDAEKQQEKEISVDVDEEIYDAKKEKIEDEDINKEAIIETEVYVDPSVNPASNNIDNGDDRKESDEPLVAVDSLESSEVVAAKAKKKKN